MVLLTVVAPSNNHTISFRHPPPKPNYIRLISCSLYNSWYNLKDNGQIKIKDTKKPESNPIFLSVTTGYYNPESMKKAISGSLAEHSSVKISIDLNTSLGNLVINNLKNQYLITLSENLKTLFAVVKENRFTILVKKFTSPTAYFIHCDLIDKEQNLLKGEPSSILALFDIKGVPYEKVRY